MHHKCEGTISLNIKKLKGSMNDFLGNNRKDCRGVARTGAGGPGPSLAKNWTPPREIFL